MENNTIKEKRVFIQWIRPGLEVIAFLLLLSKIIPEDWVEECRAGGVLAIWFLGCITVLTIFVNYFIYHEYKKELNNERIVFSNEKSQLNNRITSILHEKSSLERRARYAKMFPLMNLAFRELHNTIRKPDLDIHEYKKAFTEFCQKLSAAFRESTDVECHICIKKCTRPSTSEYLRPEDLKKHMNEIFLKTFVRSSSSTDRRIPDNGDYSHPISRNMAYLEYITNKNHQEYYFCNDLLKLDTFESSTLLAYGERTWIVNFKGVPYNTRKERWVLPYKSIITVPIIPSIRETESDKNILGFLSLDCDDIDKFLEDIDIHILIGAADGIYNSLDRFLKMESNNLNC